MPSTIVPPGFSCPSRSARFDDRKTDSILDRAARVEELGLRVDRRANAARYVIELDEWRPPDRVEDAVIRLQVALVRHHRLVLRFVVVLRAVVLLAVDVGSGGSALAVSTELAVLLAATESRLMIESPASGGASGCLK